MSNYKIRNSSGGFVDPCIVPVNVRDSTGTWRQLKQGDMYRDNSSWQYISCGITVQLTITKTPAATPADVDAFTLLYYANGQQIIVGIPNIAFAPPINVDRDIPVRITWDNLAFTLRLDGVIITGGTYEFIPSVDFKINAREI